MIFHLDCLSLFFVQNNWIIPKLSDQLFLAFVIAQSTLHASVGHVVPDSLRLLAHRSTLSTETYMFPLTD